MCIADIVSVQALGHLTLVVNTIEAAKEMFERRSGIYSDRPRIPMVYLCVQNPFPAYICIHILFQNGVGLQHCLDALLGRMAHEAQDASPISPLRSRHAISSAAEKERGQAHEAATREP